MDRQFLVLDIVAGRYKCIGKDLVVFSQGKEPPESWFDPTTVSIAKGNEISLTEAFITNTAQINPNKDVDRFEVIDESGRAYVKGSIYGTPVKVELSYQDDGKTLKVFVSDRA